MSEIEKSVACNTAGPNAIEKIANGELPQNFEALDEVAKSLIRINAKTAQTLAVIVADVRSNHLRSTTEWTMWASTTLQLQGAYLHHLHRIGKLLTGLLQNGSKCCMQYYRRLFNLPFNSLYPLSRLAVDQVGPWLTHYKPEEMTRENIRDAVAAFLGESVEPRSEQPALPGFEDILDDLISIDKEALKTIVKDSDTAKRSLYAGFELLDAAIMYHQRATECDVVLLQTTKKALLSGIDEIEKIIAEKK